MGILEEGVLYTKKEFEEQLGQFCASQDVYVSYTLRDDLKHEYIYGQKGKDEASQSKNIDLKNGFKLNVEVWGSNNDCILTKCEMLFMEYWNYDSADETTGFPTTESTSMRRKCNNTLQYYHEQNQLAALIMLDLDYFKKVNDAKGHKIGSKILGEFAKLLFSVFYDCGIMIHQSGDEFNIIFPYDDLVEPVARIKKARDLVKAHAFLGDIKWNLTMSVGVKCLDNEALDFIDARTQAELSYNPSKEKNSVKQRDSIRFAGHKGYTGTDRNMKLAWARLVSNLEYAISGNVYLEYIRRYSRSIENIDSLQKEIEDIREWINPGEKVVTMRFTEEHTKMDTSEEISGAEICLSVVQGLLKNEHFLQQDFCFKIEEDEIRIYMGDKVIFKLPNKLSFEKFEGKCDKFYRKKNNERYKRSVLVQAGYDKRLAAQDLFYKIVRVDTRPTLGGGLPDFWAAALCELITLMEGNPIFSDIIVWGDTKNTSYIMELFRSIEHWGNGETYSFDYISKKTFKSVDDIRAFQERFRGHIHICDESDMLYHEVYKIYTQDISEEAVGVITERPSKRRTLKRDLNYTGIALSISDGCRVKTMAEAYPTVLEILRQKALYNIKDQAGRELRELRDFKIVLSSPTSGELPDYYTDDRQLLDKYYEEILGKPDSLFRERLIKDKQWDALLNHVIQAIDGGNNYATRRAVLVIPNIVEDKEDYSPLGLISIWLAPRFIDERVDIDFSYNWRTVEVVIGLPLSMYASVRFSEEITNMIAEKSRTAEKIRLGAVTYIAHSLHMFQETESMDIVREIINDASI